MFKICGSSLSFVALQVTLVIQPFWLQQQNSESPPKTLFPFLWQKSLLEAWTWWVCGRESVEWWVKDLAELGGWWNTEVSNALNRAVKISSLIKHRVILKLLSNFLWLISEPYVLATPKPLLLQILFSLRVSEINKSFSLYP